MEFRDCKECVNFDGVSKCREHPLHEHVFDIAVCTERLHDLVFRIDHDSDGVSFTRVPNKPLDIVKNIS